MPTWRDSDGIVHQVDILTSTAYLCCTKLGDYYGSSSRRVPDEGPMSKLSTHESLPVTCIGCLAESPPKAPIDEFIICDACGQLWQETEEVLVPTTREALDLLGSFRIVAEGTLPTCRCCKPPT
jgi:hypothetical protein